jgi:hypothetical protein
MALSEAQGLSGVLLRVAPVETPENEFCSRRFSVPSIDPNAKVPH